MSNALATLETFARRVWWERDETAIDALTAPAIRMHGLGTQPLTGPEEFKLFHRSVCALLTDTDMVVDHSLEADGWIAALCRFTGTTASGQDVSVTGSIHARVVDGKVHESYNHFDFIGFFSQVGLLPPDTFQRCMSGQPVGGNGDPS